MKRVLVDSKDNIVYEGTDAKEILRILNAGVHDVSEEDEVKYESKFRPLIGKGYLRYEVHFDLKFKGIDDWNRPVFKDIDANLYFGDVNKLWVFRELGKNNEDVIKYYKENPDALDYFGTSFNCEPNGGTQAFFKFNFIQ